MGGRVVSDDEGPFPVRNALDLCFLLCCFLGFDDDVCLLLFLGGGGGFRFFKFVVLVCRLLQMTLWWRRERGTLRTRKASMLTIGRATRMMRTKVWIYVVVVVVRVWLSFLLGS